MLLISKDKWNNFFAGLSAMSLGFLGLCLVLLAFVLLYTLLQADQLHFNFGYYLLNALTLLIMVTATIGLNYWLINQILPIVFFRFTALQQGLFNTIISFLSYMPPIILALLAIDYIIPFLSQVSSTSGYSLLVGIIVLTFLTFPMAYLVIYQKAKALSPIYKDTAYSLGADYLDTYHHVYKPLLKKSYLNVFLLMAARIGTETMALSMILGNSHNMSFSSQYLWGLLSPSHTFTTSLLQSILSLQLGDAAILAIIILLFNTIIHIVQYYLLPNKASK